MTDLVCHVLIVSRSDWSSEDCDGTKAKAKEQTNSLLDYNMPKSQTDIDQKADANEIAFIQLQTRQSDPKEEPVEVTDSLIPPPLTKMSEDTVEKNSIVKLSEVERKLQQEEEKYEQYQRIYIGQLREEQESDTESDCSGYSCFV